MPLSALMPAPVKTVSFFMVESLRCKIRNEIGRWKRLKNWKIGKLKDSENCLVQDEL
jgi:hypothetical protein